MDKGLVSALLGLSAVLILAAPASAGRHCRYEGRIFDQGDLVCIRVDGKTRLARCGMLLNNASWDFIQDGCPTAALAASDGLTPRPGRPLGSFGQPTVSDLHVIVP